MEEVFVIDAESHEDVKKQLTDARNSMRDILKSHKNDVEVNGGAMEVGIGNSQLILLVL